MTFLFDCRGLVWRHWSRRRESLFVRAAADSERIRAKERGERSEGGKPAECCGSVGGGAGGAGWETKSCAPGNEPAQRSEKAVGREAEQCGDRAYTTGANRTKNSLLYNASVLTFYIKRWLSKEQRCTPGHFGLFSWFLPHCFVIFSLQYITQCCEFCFIRLFLPVPASSFLSHAEATWSKYKADGVVMLLVAE